MRYIKDSNNYYTIYINQGEDSELSIPLSSLSLYEPVDVDTEFYGDIRQHSASIKSIPLGITTSGANLIVTISAEDSSSMKSQKYLFDIFVKQNNKQKVIVSGEIQLKRTITRI